jgi:hypothetical protein
MIGEPAGDRVSVLGKFVQNIAVPVFVNVPPVYGVNVPATYTIPLR